MEQCSRKNGEGMISDPPADTDRTDLLEKNPSNTKEDQYCKLFRSGQCPDCTISNFHQGTGRSFIQILIYNKTYCFFKYSRTVSLHHMAGQSMAKGHFVFLTLLLISGIFSVGCLGEDTSAPVPPATNPQASIQPGQVLQVYGDVTGLGIPHGTIDTITFTVGLVPEVKSMDMEELVIVYADAIRTETLTPVKGFRGDPSPGSWGILSVQNEIGDPNNRISYEELFTIRINPKAPIVPNQMITIMLKPPTGQSTSIRRITPTTIMAENILPSI
jgi:hypothetical protein